MKSSLDNYDKHIFKQFETLILQSFGGATKGNRKYGFNVHSALLQKYVLSTTSMGAKYWPLFTWWPICTGDLSEQMALKNKWPIITGDLYE